MLVRAQPAPLFEKELFEKMTTLSIVAMALLLIFCWCVDENDI